ncbi:hypothetical protein EI94DRAFT_1730408 [Lactarius quietus]|nr:hypothetical protein EI94DRAFT_1730408 [Lactarius quietus]
MEGFILLHFIVFFFCLRPSSSLGPYKSVPVGCLGNNSGCCSRKQYIQTFDGLQPLHKQPALREVPLHLPNVSSI